MSWPAITGWSRSELIAFLPASRPLISMPRPSIVGAIPQTSGATARTPGMRLSSSAKLAGRWLKTGLGTFSRRMISPSIRLRGVAHQVAQTVGEAEEPQHAQDRDRQANQSQDRPQRPGQQVAPGESTHQ